MKPKSCHCVNLGVYFYHQLLHMYNREEVSKIKQAFWTAFGLYMRPVPSATGLKVNWVNYKTGIKHLYFKMDTEPGKATIQILLNHSNEEERLAFYDQWLLNKAFLEEALGEEWLWEREMTDNTNHSCISKSLDGVEVLRKQDWPAIISFFKPRIIAIDAFWNEMRMVFEM